MLQTDQLIFIAFNSRTRFTKISNINKYAASDYYQVEIIRSLLDICNAINPRVDRCVPHYNVMSFISNIIYKAEIHDKNKLENFFHIILIIEFKIVF